MYFFAGLASSLSFCTRSTMRTLVPTAMMSVVSLVTIACLLPEGTRSSSSSTGVLNSGRVFKLSSMGLSVFGRPRDERDAGGSFTTGWSLNISFQSSSKLMAAVVGGCGERSEAEVGESRLRVATRPRRNGKVTPTPTRRFIRLGLRVQDSQALSAIPSAAFHPTCITRRRNDFNWNGI